MTRTEPKTVPETKKQPKKNVAENRGDKTKNRINSYCFRFTVSRVFSAVDAHSSKSSIVAIKVGSLPSKRMSVMTLVPSCVVCTVNPAGVSKLSGPTASATAAADFTSA